MDRLDSWKEIAAYLNRSVRTVRRWEHEEGLPVHRHVHHKLGSVYAHKSEVDAWQQLVRRAPVARVDSVSIAVLPFANLSTDLENEYFADGLTEEVTTNLSKLRALRVTSRTSARSVGATAKGVKAIAEELGVRYVLEGSVRRAGNRLRITAQLIDATKDVHLWADTWDGTVDDIFAIQERLARVIADALKVRLTPDEEQRLAERPIDSLPAYECYLRARHEALRWRKDAIDHAVHLLQEGLKIIGDNARLYAALGFAYLQYREAGIDTSERPLVEAETCAAKVFALEPASASALQLRGWLQYSRGRIQEAVRDLNAALALEPNNADTLLILSNCYLVSGRVSSARPLIARVLAIDPLTPLTRCMPAYADILEGKFEAAIEPYRQMFEMDPSNPMARLFYVWVLILNRRNDEATAIVNTFPAETRDTMPAQIAWFLTGKPIPSEISADSTTTDVFPRLLAQGFAQAGMPDAAMRWLKVAIDRGFINYPYLAQHDPFFKPMRNDPRFKELLETVHDRSRKFDV